MRGSTIGRAAEVAQARELLLREEVGLVTLSGPGGSGKTRLALQIATSLLDEFDDGVFLVMLAPISDPGLVPATIAGVLGLREAADRQLVERLIENLRERRVLLLLDNFEQLLEAAPLVASMLGACPRLKVLVTSRAALRLRGERELAVRPLGLPESSNEPISAERLEQYTAVALFIDRAREVRPDFAVTSENAPAVAEICRRLDGLPLAIELAAARSRLLGPEAMLGRLGRRLPFLIGGSRDLPARQQTLSDTIGWSYDLLDPGERRLFQRLSVFAGGSTLEAIEAVCGLGRELDVDPFEAVASLVDKSLVRQQAVSGEPRFTMLETIREYAVERLEASGEAAGIRRRHVDFYLQLAELAEPELRQASDAQWLDLLESEHDNLRAALAWCDTASEAHHLLPRLAAPLHDFWWHRGHWSEGRRWLERGMERAVEPAARIRAMRGVGQFATHQADYARAASLWDEVLTLARATGDVGMAAFALGRRGYVAASMGDPQSARALADESLTLSRQLDDPECVAGSLMDVGHAARARDDLECAGFAWEECARVARECGLNFIVPYALQLLSLTRANQGNLSHATTLCEEALTLFQQRNDWWGIQNCLGRLTRIAQVQGERPRWPASS